MGNVDKSGDQPGIEQAQATISTENQSTETTEPTEKVEEATGQPEQAEGEQAAEDDPRFRKREEDPSRAIISTLRKEAANYRTKLRSAEEALEVERAKVKALQISAIRKAGRIDPTALIRAGVSLDSLIDADGVVNEQAVAAEVDGMKRALGIPDFPPPMESMRGGGLDPSQRPSSGNPVADALRVRHRRLSV